MSLFGISGVGILAFFEDVPKSLIIVALFVLLTAMLHIRYLNSKKNSKFKNLKKFNFLLNINLEEKELIFESKKTEDFAYFKIISYDFDKELQEYEVKLFLEFWKKPHYLTSSIKSLNSKSKPRIVQDFIGINCIQLHIKGLKKIDVNNIDYEIKFINKNDNT